MNEAMDFINRTGIKIKKSKDRNKQELNNWLGIDESILDTEKKKLNPDLWDKKKLKPKVKKQILDIVEEMLRKCNNLKIKEDLDILVIEGSNLGYYYNKYTDIDIHLYIDDLSEKMEKKIDEEIDIINKSEIFITGTKNVLEFYRMDNVQANKSNGVKYDLLNDKWLEKPNRIDMPKERYLAAVEIALTFARDLDLAIGEIKRDIIGYISLDEEIEDVLNVDLERLKENKIIKLQEIKADLEALITKHALLKDMRRKAYSEEFVPNEETLYYFKHSDIDRNYTLYNMVFKILQRFGYIDPLKILKYDIYNKALEKKDFDNNIKSYIKDIVKVLDLFNEIDESRL